MQIFNETIYRDLSSEDQAEFEEEMEAAAIKCATVQDLIAELSSTHEKLESGYRAPKKKFLFDIQFSAEFSTPIGLFGDETQCQAARKRLLEHGLDLSACYDRRVFWNSVWR